VVARQNAASERSQPPHTAPRTIAHLQMSHLMESGCRQGCKGPRTKGMRAGQDTAATERRGAGGNAARHRPRGAHPTHGRNGAVAVHHRRVALQRVLGEVRGVNLLGGLVIVGALVRERDHAEDGDQHGQEAGGQHLDAEKSLGVKDARWGCWRPVKLSWVSQCTGKRLRNTRRFLTRHPLQHNNEADFSVGGAARPVPRRARRGLRGLHLELHGQLPRAAAAGHVRHRARVALVGQLRFRMRVCDVCPVVGGRGGR